jgi:hypothetical protein
VNQRLLEQLRDAVRDNRHRFTEHAFDELHADQLTTVDAESAVLTGQIVRTEPDTPDEPGPRYTIVGQATDLHSRVGVVCRFEPADQLLIITCYEILNKHE